MGALTCKPGYLYLGRTAVAKRVWQSAQGSVEPKTHLLAVDSLGSRCKGRVLKNKNIKAWPGLCTASLPIPWPRIDRQRG